MAKYIIEIEDAPSMLEDGFAFHKCVDAPWWYISDMHINRLKPYEDAERKQGKWKSIGWSGRIHKCNQCGNMLDFGGVNAGRGDANFCPNCGADMRKENES